jgi:hypothetical protein
LHAVETGIVFESKPAIDKVLDEVGLNPDFGREHSA